jgi:hypothetical protein
VELRSKQLHAVWDVGGGRREVSLLARSLVYIPASDRHAWYRVDLARRGDTVSLALVLQRHLGGPGEHAHDVDPPDQVHAGEVHIFIN